MSWLVRYYRSTLGKKTLMAVTGIILFGYIVVHLLGNLQVFQGPERINAYAEFLHANPALVWGTRLVLLASVVLHIVAAFQVWWRNRTARDVKYRVFRPPAVDYAARTMIWSGVIIAVYVVYHLLHLTTGRAHPDFVGGDIYRNLIVAFTDPIVALVYVVANLLLGLHLYHGLWSLFQTLGWEHPKWNAARRAFAVVTALLITVGYVSIPLAIYSGAVR